MNAPSIAAAGMMFAVVGSTALAADRIEYRTPVTQATPLGFTLSIQSRPSGEPLYQSRPSASVVTVASQGGSAYRGTYYVRPVSYGNHHRGRLNVSGYHYGRSGYGSSTHCATTVVRTRVHGGTVAVAPGCNRTVSARPCVY